MSYPAFSREFTVASYNCGGLPGHYDYLRAACMQEIMKERREANPLEMLVIERIQKLALKILFSPFHEEKHSSQEELNRLNESVNIPRMIAFPTTERDSSWEWHQKALLSISNYKKRPIKILNEKVKQKLQEHFGPMDPGNHETSLRTIRGNLALTIFDRHLTHDIICVQEADYLHSSMFPRHYEVLISQDRSKNGIAWNTERFRKIETIGSIFEKAFAVRLEDKRTGEKIVVASGHLTGCNPFAQGDLHNAPGDSIEGNCQLDIIVKQLDEKYGDDLKVIGIDSNVTSFHPRLSILKNAGYQIDYENHLEPTCTNPYQVLDTRIDWIAVKGPRHPVSITNIPVYGVELNDFRTNISDHTPIAAKIGY